MKHLTRNAVIDLLRDHLQALCDDETSICMVAARKGIFCKGFRRFTDQELRQKFDWIASSRPELDRAELEDVINKYKLGRSSALGLSLSCDAQMIDRDTCLGWDEFKDAELQKFYQEWLGEPVEIVSPGWTGKGKAAV